MLTKQKAKLLYQKLCGATTEWLQSKKGKQLVRKAIELVRKEEGEAEAKTFEGLMAVAETPSTLTEK